jgi:hypothetical protein
MRGRRELLVQASESKLEKARGKAEREEVLLSESSKIERELFDSKFESE